MNTRNISITPDKLGASFGLDTTFKVKVGVLLIFYMKEGSEMEIKLTS